MKWREETNCGCKVNLRLKVTGKRADGLHELSSCFIYLPCPGDKLSVTEHNAPLTLSCPGFPELENQHNLLWKAAMLFAEKSRIVPSWHIMLEKRVPMAAGLGGGSADAGALLAMLNRRYQSLSDNELNETAFALGADVPFFLHRQPAWVTGAGEKIEYLENLTELPEILIVYPAFPVSAKWAYTHLDKAVIGAEDKDIKAAFLNGSVQWNEFCRNDLAPAVVKKFPLITVLMEFLKNSGAAAVQMSGSGPSVFALFARGKELRDKWMAYKQQQRDRIK